MKSKSETTATTTINDLTQFPPLFRYLFECSTYAYIDPFFCIHFTRIRQTSDSGVKKLIELYDTTDSQSDHNKFSECAFGKDTHCIVALVGSLSN